MHVKYRCAVRGQIRLPFAFDIPTSPVRYEFELGDHGQLTHVSAVLEVADQTLWPTFRPSEQPTAAFHLNLTSPYFDLVRRDLRAAEGMLALLGLESIDTANAEQIWLPDTAEEKEALEVGSFKRTKELRPIQMPPTSFDLVARAFLSAHRAGSIETPLSFYRKGRAEVIDARYIEAVIDFLFMIESLYASGQFKSAQVEQEYLSSEALLADIEASLSEHVLLSNVADDDRIKKAFRRDYLGKTSADIVRHLVKLRGFLHHHSKDRKNIWHPDDHVRYGADAYFLQQLCFATGFRLVTPVLFAEQHVKEYQQLANQFSQRQNGGGSL